MNGYLVLARTELFDVPLLFTEMSIVARDYAAVGVGPADVALQYEALFGEKLDPATVLEVGFIQFNDGVPVKWVKVREFETVVEPVE